MARATKRTSVLLGTLAVVFIAIIIILCIVPHGGSPHDTTQEAQRERPVADVITEPDTTTALTSTTTTTTTTTTAPTTHGPTTYSSTTTTTTTSEPTTAPTTHGPAVYPSTTTITTTPEPTTTPATPEPTTAPLIPESTTSPTTTESTTVPTTPESTAYTTIPESTAYTTTPESTAYTTTPESTAYTTTPESTVVPTISESINDVSTSESTTAVTTTPESTTDVTSSEPANVSLTSEATTVLTTYESTTVDNTSEPVSVSPTSEATTASTTSEATTASTTSEATTDSTTSEATTASTTSEATTASTTSEATTASATSEFPTTLTTAQFSTELLTATETTSQEPLTISSTTTAASPLCPVNASAAGVTCNTTACKTVAANMLAMMDHSQGVNPCQNFYQYACGGLMQNPFLDARDPRVLAGRLIKEKLDTLDHNSTPEGKMKLFYDSCISAVGQESIEDWAEPVKQLFGVYRLGQQPPSNDLTDMLAYMMERDFAPFFDVNLGINRNDTEQFLVTLRPAVPVSLSENPVFSEDLARKVCLEEHHRNLEKTAYYDVEAEYGTFTNCVLTGKGLEARLGRMEEAVQRLGLLDGFADPIAASQLVQDTKDMTRNVLKDLANELPSIPQLKKALVNWNYTQRSIHHFSNAVIDWEVLANKLITSSSAITEVQVYMEDKIAGAMNVLEKYYNQNPTALSDVLLMLWSERLYTDFVKPVGSNVGEQEYCLRAAITLMQDTASFLYMDALSYDEIKARHDQINSIAESVKHAGERALRNLTEQQPAEKLKDMLDHIITGGMKDLKDMEKWHKAANESVEMLNITATEFLNNCLQLLKNRRTLLYSMYTEATSSMWRKFMRPYDPTGVHVYALSRIMIPFAALKNSSVFRNVPEYLSYAGIGHIISNLVMHGYDTTGLYYQDGRYELMDGFTHFNTSLQGLKKQLTARQTYKGPDDLTAIFTMDTISLNELLADSGATRLAWEAYLLRNEMMPSAAPPSATFVGKDAFRRRRRSTLNTVSRRKRATSSHASPEPPLPWLNLSPLQLYFVHWSQHHCSADGGMSMLELMESEKPPAMLRVNLVLQNEPLFNQAFKCTPKVETPFTLG